MNGQGEGQADHSTWQTESLRLTAFPIPGTPVGEPTWWSALVGKAPDVRTKRPSLSLFQDEGEFQELKLVLTAQPSRIDWHLLLPEQRRLDLVLQTVGPFQGSLKTFAPLMKEWLKLSPPLGRLAFGAVLLQTVADRVDGYRQLAKYLPAVTIDPEHSADFSYQINRPRNSNSGVAGLTINRLSKWAVALHGITLLSVKPQPAEVLTRAEAFAVRLEFDINTPAEFARELPQEKLAEVFDEEMALGSEIAEGGDIP